MLCRDQEGCKRRNGGKLSGVHGTKKRKDKGAFGTERVSWSGKVDGQRSDGVEGQTE